MIKARRTSQEPKPPPISPVHTAPPASYKKIILFMAHPQIIIETYVKTFGAGIYKYPKRYKEGYWRDLCDKPLGSIEKKAFWRRGWNHSCLKLSNMLSKKLPDLEWHRIQRIAKPPVLLQNPLEIVFLFHFAWTHNYNAKSEYCSEVDFMGRVINPRTFSN